MSRRTPLPLSSGEVLSFVKCYPMLLRLSSCPSKKLYKTFLEPITSLHSSGGLFSEFPVLFDFEFEISSA